MADKKKKDNLPSDSEDLEKKVEELERQKSSLEKKLTNLALKVAGLEKTAYDYSLEKCSTRVRWSGPELPMLMQNSKDKSLPEPRDQPPKILHLLDSSSEISADSGNRFKRDSKKILDPSTSKKQRDSTLSLLPTDGTTIDSSETGQVLTTKDPRNIVQQHQRVKNQQEFEDNSPNDPNQKRTNKNAVKSREGTYKTPDNQYSGDADNLDDSGGVFRNKPKPRQQDKVFNMLDSDGRDKSKRSPQTSKQNLRPTDPNNAPNSEYYVPKSVRQDSSSVPPENTNELSKNLANVNKSRQPRQRGRSSMIDPENPDTVNESGITSNKPTSTQDNRSPDRSKPKYISSNIDKDTASNNSAKLRDFKTRSPSKDKALSGNMSRPSNENLANVNKSKSKPFKQDPMNQDNNDGETGNRGKNNYNEPTPNQDPRLIIVIEPQNNTNSNINISISEVPADKHALKYKEDKPKSINRDPNFVPSNEMNELGNEFRPDLNKRQYKQDENMKVSEPKAVGKERETGKKGAIEKTKPPFDDQDAALIFGEQKQGNPRHRLDKNRGVAPPEEYTSQPKEGKTRTPYQDSDYVPSDNSALNRYTRDNKYRGEAPPEKYISRPKEGKTEIYNQDSAYSGGNKVLKKQNQQGSGASGKKPFSMLDFDESFSDTASKTDGDVVLLFTPSASSNVVTGDQSKDLQKAVGGPDEISMETSSEEIEPISQESLKSRGNDGLKCAEGDEKCQCQKILRENGEWRKNVNSILETLIMNSYGDKCPLDLIKDLMDPAKRDNAIKQLTARMNLAANQLYPGDLNNTEEPDDKKAIENQNEGAKPSLTVNTKEDNFKAKPLSTFDEYPPYPPAIFEGKSEPVNRNENRIVSVSRSPAPAAITPCLPTSSGRSTPPCQSNQSPKSSSYQCVSTQNKIVDIVCAPGSRPVIHIPSRTLPPPSVCPRLTDNVQVVCCSPKNPCPKHK